jgi:hypothetical protein
MRIADPYPYVAADLNAALHADDAPGTRGDWRRILPATSCSDIGTVGLPDRFL